VPQPVELTRKQLFDLIWSKSVQEAAAELGISSTGLRNICKHHRVPMPWRGLWQRARAGLAMPSPFFREIDEPQLDRVKIYPTELRLPASVKAALLEARARVEPAQSEYRQPDDRARAQAGDHRMRKNKRLPKTMITLRILPDQVRRLDRLANMQQRTRSSLINQLIAQGLKREERKKQDSVPVGDRGLE
jgi:hypothetical protein